MPNKDTLAKGEYSFSVYFPPEPTPEQVKEVEDALIEAYRALALEVVTTD